MKRIREEEDAALFSYYRKYLILDNGNKQGYSSNDDDYEESGIVTIILDDFIGEGRRELFEQPLSWLYTKFQLQAKGKIKWLDAKREYMLNKRLNYIPIEFSRDKETVLHALETLKCTFDVSTFATVHPCVVSWNLALEYMPEEGAQDWMLKNIRKLIQLNKPPLDDNQPPSFDSITESQNQETILHSPDFIFDQLVATEDYSILKNAQHLYGDHDFIIRVFKHFNGSGTLFSILARDEQLKKDDKLIIQLAKINASILSQVDDELMSKKLFLTDLLDVNPSSLKYMYFVRPNLRRMVVEEKVQHIMAFEKDKMENCKEFIFLYCVLDPKLLTIVSPSLLKDRSFMFELLSHIYKHARTFRLNAVFNDVILVDVFREDFELMLIAISIDRDCFSLIAEKLRNDKKFCLQALVIHEELYKLIPGELLRDREFAISCLKINGAMLKRMPKDMKGN